MGRRLLLIISLNMLISRETLADDDGLNADITLQHGLQFRKKSSINSFPNYRTDIQIPRYMYLFVRLSLCKCGCARARVLPRTEQSVSRVSLELSTQGSMRSPECSQRGFVYRPNFSLF